MALSKKDLVINITLNELYNTHSLILQHIEALVRLILQRLHYLLTLSPLVTKRQATPPHPHRRARGRTAPSASKGEPSYRVAVVQPMGDAGAGHPAGFGLTE